MDFTNNENQLWLIIGSQRLYGDEVLKQVRDHGLQVAKGLDDTVSLPVNIQFKSVLTTSDEIYNLCLEANNSPECIGLIVWMHTFSPAKMWIAGLKALNKPFVHLHTQYNREIPWDTIDMDFMNLNQSAHGGREFGFICTRMQIQREVIVGHWQDSEVHDQLETWARAALAWQDAQNMKIARFGDNMRNVAVTEGNKVSAQIQFGFEVHGYGVGDLVSSIDQVSKKEIDRLLEVYVSEYKNAEKLINDPNSKKNVAEAARIELGLKYFLEAGGFSAFTTTFEDLHGLSQLPGLAVQRLMAQGYGFGAEGDWKTAGLVRSMKVMSRGLKGGTSFMEDYTYHLDPDNALVLGAHMLEVCPSIANAEPALEVHPLSIGGKNDPARLVFDVPEGAGLNATLIDLGDRFRLLINKVKVVNTPALPKLPVARTAWKPLPDLNTSAKAWILAGGGHHTTFTQALTPDHMELFAEMAGVELIVIDENTSMTAFKNNLHWHKAN